MFGIYDINNCNKLTYKERLDIYKEAGFDEIALYLDERYQRDDESYIEIIGYANKIGLKIKQVHIDYKISNLICDESTSEYFYYVSAKLVEAASFGIPYVVAHASMTDNPPQIPQSQIDKFANMMKYLETLPTTLCLENVRNNYNLEKLLSLNLPNVKMCFDLGHAHCYGNEQQLFNKFKKQIACSHLHNNFGKDSHNPLNQGEISYEFYLTELEKIKDSSNCLECFPEKGKILSKEEFTEFVKRCYQTIKAKPLEK